MIRRLITSRPWLYRIAKRIKNSGKTGRFRWKLVTTCEKKWHTKFLGPMGQNVHCFAIRDRGIACWIRKPWED